MVAPKTKNTTEIIHGVRASGNTNHAAAAAGLMLAAELLYRMMGIE